MYDEIIRLVSNLGFPAAVSLYLLVRLDKRLQELTEAFSELTKTFLTVVEHQKK